MTDEYDWERYGRGTKVAGLFISEMADAASRAEKLSDLALAGGLLEKVWGAFRMDSDESSLIAEAIDRLKKPKADRAMLQKSLDYLDWFTKHHEYKPDTLQCRACELKRELRAYLNPPNAPHE